MAILERISPTSSSLYESLKGHASPRVIEAMRQVPRRSFVHPIHYLSAYKDVVLPIPSIRSKSEVATISQPRVVAMMTNLLDPQPNESVLEIGTASGYQAAVLSKLAAKVVTVDIIPKLTQGAKKRFRKLGIENVEVVLADGSVPFARQAVFDKILITASTIPYIQAFDLSAYSLKEGGICVAPVGGKHGDSSYGDLARIRKTNEGFEIEERIPGVGFVLMQGKAGWDSFLRGYAAVLHNDFFKGKKEAE
ncbi:methyltransferase domain-containing protein [Patescibacteria group bacterium]|nr:methyltransferase domain-containing protein [Patescibacteria group bacterium]